MGKYGFSYEMFERVEEKMGANKTETQKKLEELIRQQQAMSPEEFKELRQLEHAQRVERITGRLEEAEKKLSDGYEAEAAKLRAEERVGGCGGCSGAEVQTPRHVLQHEVDMARVERIETWAQAVVEVVRMVRDELDERRAFRADTAKKAGDAFGQLASVAVAYFQGQAPQFPPSESIEAQIQAAREEVSDRLATWSSAIVLELFGLEGQARFAARLTEEARKITGEADKSPHHQA